MKIELTTMQTLALAKDFAELVHGEVVYMHLRASHGIWPYDSDLTPYPGRREDLQAMQAAIRSIPDKWDRYTFVLHIKYYFQEIRREKHTDIKWQDHVAKVKTAYANHVQEMRRMEAWREREEGVAA